MHLSHNLNRRNVLGRLRAITAVAVLLCAIPQSASAAGFWDQFTYVSIQQAFQNWWDTHIGLALSPKDTNHGNNRSHAGNVSQGIAYLDGHWFMSQAHKTEAVLFNRMNSAGTSRANWEFDKTSHRKGVEKSSHGQDLSVLRCQGTNNCWRLFTDSPKGNGISVYTVGSNPSPVSTTYELFSALPSRANYRTKSTPTLNVESNIFAVRAIKNNDQDDRVFLYNRSDVEAGSTTPIADFSLAPEQTVSAQWFQGIAMKGNRIYCLTGNNRFSDTKLLYVYERPTQTGSTGQVLYSKVLTPGKSRVRRAVSNPTFYEIEGLTIKGNGLYTTINYGQQGGKRIKRLYRIMTIN